ncbi:MAG TPA: NAD(P)/FAD-dependent oxidoreductase [Anaerolineae bacterium]|nr:NAD(P)/FAD-dependent oxidoreductase [Anaerolineae bacterium]
MSEASSYDVVVVGAGPAGSCSALAAAEAGARVLLLDKKREVGVPVQCAEYVPRQLAAHVPWSHRCVAQQIALMRTHLPDGQSVETPSPGYVIDRALFDKTLAAAARRAGADLLLRARAAERTARGLVIRQGAEEFEVEAKIIVGADGPRSTVGRWIGQVNRQLVIAAQCQVVLEQPLEATQVYFDPYYPGGYGWLFPKGQVANVGVGVGLRFKRDPREALGHLLDRLKINPQAVIGYTGGLIPSGGPPERTWEENIILVGDAAGQTHPITGAGVAHACLCGQLAGKAAARAALHSDLSLLGEYEQEWRDFLGGILAHALARRRELDKSWSDEPVALARALRENWVAFPAYGRREGSRSRTRRV